MNAVTQLFKRHCRFMVSQCSICLGFYGCSLYGYMAKGHYIIYFSSKHKFLHLSIIDILEALTWPAPVEVTVPCCANFISVS